jgi:hypothetical protein
MSYIDELEASYGIKGLPSHMAFTQACQEVDRLRKDSDRLDCLNNNYTRLHHFFTDNYPAFKGHDARVVIDAFRDKILVPEEKK